MKVKHGQDPRFDFLQAGHPYHRYYREVIEEHETQLRKEAASTQNAEKTATMTATTTTATTTTTTSSSAKGDGAGCAAGRAAKQATAFTSDDQRLAKATIGGTATVAHVGAPQDGNDISTAASAAKREAGGQEEQGPDRRRRRRRRRFDVPPSNPPDAAVAAAVAAAADTDARESVASTKADARENGTLPAKANGDEPPSAVESEEERKKRRRLKAKEFALKVHMAKFK